MLALLLFLATADPAAETGALFAKFTADKPGCVAGVVRNGKTVFAKGYGLADVEQQTPLTPKSVFYLASVSKQSMAFAILLLEKQGKLSIDDPIGKYVEGLPAHTAPITLRQLLHHTGGVRDYLTLGVLAGYSPDHVWTEPAALAMIRRQKALNFAPGSEFLYSNSGYVLLSLAAQKVIGGRLDPWMREHVWKPLEMNQSRWQHDHRDPIPLKAHGYLPGPKIANSMLDVVGDGGMYASLNDLLRWAANFDSRKLGGELLDRMAVPGSNAGTYGMGLSAGKYRGLDTVSHGGSLAGYRTMLLRIPAKQTTVVTLCNTSQVESTLANRIADKWIDGFPEAVPVPADQPSPAKEEFRFENTDWNSFLGNWRSEELDATYRIYQARNQTLLEVIPGKPSEMIGRGLHNAWVAGVSVEWKAAGILTVDVGRVRGIEFRRIQ
jgi:CubicO group peptidase (beta-lactamase class C family)